MWNYRIIHTSDGSVGVYEVYYENFVPVLRATDAVSLCFKTYKALKDDMDRIKVAIQKRPMLETEDKNGWSLTNMI
ncbi:MAG: hypothetical protein ACQESN_10610 [Thermotogota bacterium]